MLAKQLQSNIPFNILTVYLSLFSLHLIEGRVIPDWKKFISSGENIIRFLDDYIAKHIRQNSSLQEGQSQQRHVISDQSCSGNIKKWAVFVL
jgi:hypothetical protein